MLTTSLEVRFCSQKIIIFESEKHIEQIVKTKVKSKCLT